MSKILMLDSSGQPTKWLNWRDAIIYHAKDLVAWELGEIKHTVYGGTNSKSGERSFLTTAAILAVKGSPSKKKFHRAPPLENTILFRRDKHTCAYCQHTFPESKLTRDHITPRFLGGPDTWMNVITACKKCNHKKDCYTIEEAGLELSFKPYVPSRAEYLILDNTSILPAQKEFLLGFVDPISRLHS